MRPYVTVVLLLLVFAGGANAQRRVEAPDAIPRTIEWFDKLGYDLVRPSVKVTTSFTSVERSDRTDEYASYGWLESVDENGFSVLHQSLKTQRYEYKTRDDEFIKGARYEVVELAAVAKDWLGKANDDRVNYGLYADWLIRPRAALFVLGRGLLLLHQDERANELFAWVRGQTLSDEPGIRQALIEDVAANRLWEIVDQLGEPDYPRGDSLRALDRFLALCAGTRHWDQAKRFFDGLSIEVVEEQTHDPVSLDELEGAALVDELIFRLRDARSWGWVQSGRALPQGDDAAARLVALGLKAVPQLISHVGDIRLTRYVASYRQTFYSHDIGTVGDACISILGTIAGRSFHDPTYTKGQTDSSGEPLPIRAEIEAWWADVQKRGFTMVLDEAVRAGGRYADTQAQVLAAVDPGAALTAIEKGLDNADEPLRIGLLKAAALLGLDRAADLLRTRMKTDAAFRVRLAAVEELAGLGDSTALTCVRDFWKRGEFKDDREAFEYAKFLVHSGDTDSVHSVTERMDALAPYLRSELVSTAADYMTRREEAGDGTLGDALLRLMASQLGDDTLSDYGGMLNGVEVAWLRQGDRALAALARCWPERFSLEHADSYSARERQRFMALNFMLAKDREPLLPSPPAPKIKQADGPALQSAWGKAISGDKAVREAGVAALEKLGLGALTFVTEQMDESSPAYLRNLQSRLASVVREVELAGVEPDDDARKAFKDETGQVFDYAMLKRLLGRCGDPPEGACGFSLHVRRDIDGTGVVIRVEFRAGEREPKSWGESYTLAVAGKREESGAGSSSSISSGSFRRAEEPLAKAAALPFDTSFELCYVASQAKRK